MQRVPAFGVLHSQEAEVVNPVQSNENIVAGVGRLLLYGELLKTEHCGRELWPLWENCGHCRQVVPYRGDN